MLSCASRVRGRGPAFLSLFLLAAVVGACQSGAALAPAGAGPGASGGGGSQTGSPAGQPLGGGGQGTNGEPGVIDQVGLLIVKNGALAIQVSGLEAAIEAAGQLIGDLGGYASASERSGAEDDAQATVTYRIPVARWDDALTGLRHLGEKVIDERYSTEEVTAQVVDLEARVANLRASEAALQAIMDRAVDINDVLTVQAQLTSTRSEIEQLVAQKTNLEGHAAFSTLAVTYALKRDPVLAEQQGFDPATEIDQASATLVGVLQGLATAGIWFGIVWLPILLALVVIALSGLLVWRRIMRRVDPEVTLPTPGASA